MDEPLSTDQEIRIEALKAAVDSFSESDVDFNLGIERTAENILTRASAFENYIRNGKES